MDETEGRIGNPAIFFEPDAFVVENRKRMMGRHVAGNSFLRGLFQHSGEREFYCYGGSKESFAVFDQIAKEVAPDSVRKLIFFGNHSALEKVGTLSLPVPGLADYAWARRMSGKPDYSLVGITHTTASDRVMDALGDLLIAPVEPWDAVICTSKAVHSQVSNLLADWSGYLEERLGATKFTRPELPVIPLGVNVEDFAIDDSKRTNAKEIRARYGIAEGEFVILFVGRLSFHAKANPVPMFLAAQKASQRTQTKVHIIQAGWFANEWIEKQFKDSAKLLAPDVSHIFLDGRDPFVRRNVWYVADVFCSLSDNVQETFGITPIEAMAAGVPCLVSDWDGYKDTVVHGKTGFRARTFMAPPGAAELVTRQYQGEYISYDRYIGAISQMVAVDVNECSHYLERFIKDPNLKRRMGRNAAQWAQQNFDWSEIIPRYQELWGYLREVREKDFNKTNKNHPLRQDPTCLFEHYPTQALNFSTNLIINNDVLEKIKKLGPEFAIIGFGSEGRLPQERYDVILKHFQNQKELSIQDIISKNDVIEKNRLLRTIIWLLKFNILSIK